MSTFNDRANKYSSKRKKKEPTRFNFGVTELTMFCSYILSENINIHHNSVLSLRKVLESIGEEIFNDNQDCIIRYRFCLKALESRIDKNITNKNILIRDIVGVTNDTFDGLDPYSLPELSNDDINWVEGTISNCCNINYINNSVLDMNNLCTEYVMTDYTKKEEISEKIKNKVAEMQNIFRKNTVDTDELNNTVDLTKCDVIISDMYRNMSRPSYKLKTGMQGLNGLLAGGFEGGKVYCFFGLPGEGKTVTLLNIAYQIKKFNREYVCKDKTKIPCIVILSMENSAQQALETMFNIACTPNPISEIDAEQMSKLMSTYLGVSEDDPINIIVRYKPINSVDTSYLYKLTDDLEDEGYEVICMIQDYIKRIKPVDRVNDMRIDLGNVINDFRNYAIHKNVPVITASQFNREGVKIIDESRNNSHHDLVNKLGRAMIGESGLIEENLDCSIFLAKEFVNDVKYMGFKCTKNRYRIFTNVLSFYQPFEKGNAVKYITDADLPRPVYRQTLKFDEEEKVKTFGITKTVGSQKTIMSQLELAEDVMGASDIDIELVSDDNKLSIFDRATTYNEETQKYTKNVAAFTGSSMEQIVFKIPAGSNRIFPLKSII